MEIFLYDFFICFFYVESSLLCDQIISPVVTERVNYYLRRSIDRRINRSLVAKMLRRYLEIDDMMDNFEIKSKIS